MVAVGGEDGSDPALTGASPAARGPAHDLPEGLADRVRHAPGALLHGGSAPLCSRPTSQAQEVLHFICNQMKGLYKMSPRKASQA